MKLKENIDYSKLLKAIPLCSGNVTLTTKDGDCLNLKSTLSQFVFAAAVNGKVQFQNAFLQVENKNDMAILQPFISED